MEYNDVNDQANIISGHFGEVALEGVDLESKPGLLPEGADWWFVIPSWKKVANTYPEACDRVLMALEKDRGDGFYNHRTGEVDDRHLRQTEPRDVSGVVACQLGTKRRVKSVEEAQASLGGRDGEVALGSYEVAVILLANPEIGADGGYWGIYCGGDEWSPGGDGVFSRSSALYFRDWGGGRRAFFGTGDVGIAGDYFGLASGFFPREEPLGPSEASTLEARVAALEDAMGRIGGIIRS